MADRIVVAVGPQTGSAPEQELTAFSGGSIKDTLAAGPEVAFSLPGKSPAALLIDGLASDVWVYRNGIPKWRCRTLPVAQAWGEDGSDDADVTAVGYRRLAGARHIVSGPPTFSAVDQGTIIWNLIQHTQATTGGNLGITQGTTTTGIVRDRNEYKIGDLIGKLADDLGDVINPCWWGVDSAKVLTVKLLSAFPTRTDPIVLGMNARNLRRTPGDSFANAAGSVGSATQTVPVWVADAGIAADPRGRWEAYDASHGSVVLQATVAEQANGLLAERNHPPANWAIDLDVAWYFEQGSMYEVGDFVPIVVPVSAVDELGAPAVNVVAQVTEVGIGFDDAGGVAVTLAAVEVSG